MKRFFSFPPITTLNKRNPIHNMDQEGFSKVAGIDNFCKKEYKFRVKILSVWLHGTSSLGPRLHMILCDEEGTRIGATVYKQDIKKFEWVKPFERYWFTLSDFLVHSNSVGSPTPSRHPHEIGFWENTKFDLIQYEFANRNHFLVFTPVNIILERNVSCLYPIDVIGVVTWVGEIENMRFEGSMWSKPRDVSTVWFTLRDKEFKGIECIARGKLAEELSIRFSKENSRHKFVVLRNFQVATSRTHTWLHSKVGLSSMEFEDWTITELYQFALRYPYPFPEEYNDDHKKDFSPF